MADESEGPEVTQETPNSASITDPPRADQLVAHQKKVFNTIKEGLAYILIPPGTRTITDPKTPKQNTEAPQSVFYNPIQQFNRDLSVLAIRAYGEDLLATRKHKWTLDAHKYDRKRKRKAERLQKGNREANGSKKPKVGGVSDSHTSATSTATLETKESSEQTAGSGDDAASNHAKNQLTCELGQMGDNEPLKLGQALNPERAVDSNIPPDQTEMQTLNRDMTGEDSKSREGPDSPFEKSPGHEVRILDALSATGLRALRYARELPFRVSVTANDMSSAATASIALNIKHNRSGDRIKPTTSNAIAHMYNFVGPDQYGRPQVKYDVIDLDPYGTAVPFLDAAVQALNDGGLLCVTCTDAGVWASHGFLEKTYALYGGLPIKGLQSHEGGLRLILNSIATSAARYGIAIEPLLSLSIDFYARVWVRIKKSPTEVKFLAGKTMLVYNCDHGCGAWKTQFLARNHLVPGKNDTPFWKYGYAQGPTAAPNCEHCGCATHLCGPMWGGPLHNPAFIERILGYLPDLDKTTYATTDRIEGMLQTALEEALSPTSENDRWAGNTKSDESEKVNRQRGDFQPLIPRTNPAAVDRHPFFFNTNFCAKVLHCAAPSDAAVKGALKHAGYRVTRSHTKAGTIRTDASWTVIWEIMREWVRQKAPIAEGRLTPAQPGWHIMQKTRPLGQSPQADIDAASDTTANGHTVNTGATQVVKGAKPLPESELERAQKLKVVFDEVLGRDESKKKIVRYQQNPRPNWGPMSRAKCSEPQ